MKPQKALHYYIESDKKNPKYLGREYAIFEKYDGWYGYLKYDDYIRSGNGRIIPSMVWLGDKIKKIQPKDSIIIFEILLRNEIKFHILNGVLNRTTGDYHAKDAYLMVHDIIFNDDMEFKKRYEFLKDNIDHDDMIIAPVIGISSNPLDWVKSAQKVWDLNGEGIILKDLHAPYQEGKRNYTLMKIKEEIDADLLVVDIAEGEGKYQGTLGALVLEDLSGTQIRVSGMTDIQRDLWWNNPSDIIGKVVKVKAMKRLPDGTLREPRFKDIRYDKNSTQID